MQLMTRLQTWRLVRQRDRNVRRIRAAKLHLENLLENTPRYWRAGEVDGGATLDLGSITKAQAEGRLARGGYGIIYIDLDEAFIAIQSSSATKNPGASDASVDGF